MPTAQDVAVTAPLVSIVVPCCGMLEYTKLCVRNVLGWSTISTKKHCAVNT